MWTVASTVSAQLSRQGYSDVRVEVSGSTLLVEAQMRSAGNDDGLEAMQAPPAGQKALTSFFG